MKVNMNIRAHKSFKCNILNKNKSCTFFYIELRFKCFKYFINIYISIKFGSDKQSIFFMNIIFILTEYKNNNIMYSYVQEFLVVSMVHIQILVANDMYFFLAK